MQYTEKLGLNLFEGTDPVLAENFNENTQKIEQQLVQRAYMVTGTYAGDGSDTITLSFDHKPMMVIVMMDIIKSTYNGSTSCTIAFHGIDHALSFSSGSIVGRLSATWDDESNSVTLADYNFSGRQHHYIAFLADE